MPLSKLDHIEMGLYGKHQQQVQSFESPEVIKHENYSRIENLRPFFNRLKSARTKKKVE